MRESSTVRESAGTLKFGSAPASSEIETGILPQTTSPKVNRPTADRALEWLEKGSKEKSSELIFPRIDPLWDKLRDDPRFQELVRKVRFPK